MKFSLGFLFGWLASVPTFLFWQSMKQPNADEVARHYEAYRVCIQERSTCRMTPQDWINYYDLKWRLEGERVE